MSDLYSLLSKVASKIEELGFNDSNILEKKSFPKIKMPKLRLLTFTASDPGSDVRVLTSMITTSSLETFHYYKDCYRTDTPQEALVLLDFMNRQTKLTQVCLRSPAINPTIEYWLKAPFKLELQQLSLDYLSTSHPANFSLTHMRFLQSQVNSLTTFYVVQAYFQNEDLQDLLSLKLRELRLITCTFKWNSSRVTQNNSIKTLMIFHVNGDMSEESTNAIVQLLSSCEKVSTLEIGFNCYDDHRFAPVLAAIVNKRNYYLKIYKPLYVKATTFPYVRQLSLVVGSSKEAKEGAMRLAQANPQLKYLVLDKKLKNDDIFDASIRSLVPTTQVIYSL